MVFFLASIGVLALGAVLSAAAGRARVGAALGPCCAALGSILGLVACAAGPWDSTSSFELAWGLPIGAFALGLDPLTKLFLLPAFVLGALCAASGMQALAVHAEDKNLGAHWFFYNMLLLGMALVLTARDAVLFLIAWETMSLSPFFLISFHDDEEKVRDASWVYLVAAHLGAAVCILFFALLWREAGSSDFAAFARMGLAGGPAGASTLFLLALFGFGAKAGFMPLHIWLPEAHPVAPSHVSAFLSGAMINAGIYGLARVLGFLGPGAGWWGWLLLGVGAATGLLGILQALAQVNVKRLLAYSSVENMGIVCLGLGAGLIGARAGQTWGAGLCMAGALFHVLNHAAFKGLLFLGAGEILHAVGTLRLNHLGGLQKRLPALGVLFLIGVAAIVGLPPLNGFAGEILIYVGLAHGGSLPGLAPRVGLLGSIFALALIGGFSLVCFVKAYGLAFLGEPRSGAAEHAHAPSLAALTPLAVLACLCVGIGLAAPAVYGLVVPAALQVSPWAVKASPQAALATDGAGILALVVRVSLVLLVLLGGLVLLRRRFLAGKPVREFRTWDCGFAAPSARMQYTSGSFSELLSKTDKLAMGLRETYVPPQGYFPVRASLELLTRDWIKTGFFTPLFEAARKICDAAKVVQHGRIHLYILYILAALVGLLAWKL